MALPDSRPGPLRNLSDLTPAALITLLVTGVLISAQLIPVGEATVLVRLPADTPALSAAAAADAALVSVPAAGFAVLHGDAGHIRSVLGLAVTWQGAAPCSLKQ